MGRCSVVADGSATTRYVNAPSTGYAFGSWGGATPWLGELTPGTFCEPLVVVVPERPRVLLAVRDVDLEFQPGADDVPG